MPYFLVFFCIHLLSLYLPLFEYSHLCMPCCLAHMRVIFTNFTVFIFVTSVVVWLPSGNAIQFVNTHKICTCWVSKLVRLVLVHNEIFFPYHLHYFTIENHIKQQKPNWKCIYCRRVRLSHTLTHIWTMGEKWKWLCHKSNSCLTNDAKINIHNKHYLEPILICSFSGQDDLKHL